MKEMAIGILIYLIVRGICELLFSLRKFINAKLLGIWDVIIPMVIMIVANYTIRDSELIPQYVFWIVTGLAIVNIVFGMVQVCKYIMGIDGNR